MVVSSKEEVFTEILMLPQTVDVSFPSKIQNPFPTKALSFLSTVLHIHLSPTPKQKGVSD